MKAYSLAPSFKNTWPVSVLYKAQTMMTIPSNPKAGYNTLISVLNGNKEANKDKATKLMVKVRNLAGCLCES